MSFTSHMSRVMFASSALALCAVAGGARALPAPSVNGYVAISALAYSVSLNAPGTEYLTGPIFVAGGDGVATAACTAQGYCNFGTGEISAVLGADPQVLLSATPQNNGGGDSSLFVSYDMEYQGPGNTIDALVHTSDVINQVGDSAAEAIMTVTGAQGTVFEAYNCQASPLAAFGCSTNLPNAPFANAPVTLVVGEVYTINLELEIYSHDPVSAEIDPYFTAPPGAGGEFIFSPGVTAGGVPEPAAWSLMVAGFGGLGALIRRHTRQVRSRLAA